jgi:hypothetical protein
MNSPLKDFLIQMSKTITHVPEGWTYGNLYDLVLSEGREMPHENAQFPQTGIRKQCFTNAFFMMMREPERYVYCEGYALGCVIPVHHGWVWDNYTKNIVDPTWDKGFGYFGIPFVKEYAIERLAEDGSCLDCWQSGWPTMKMYPPEYVGEIRT